MRLVACPEAEAGGKVAGEEMLLLDVGQKGLVNGLLVGGASTGDLLLLLKTIFVSTQNPNFSDESLRS